MLFSSFYHKKSSLVEAVNGDSFESQGWGGLIIRIDTKIYLCTPVYVCEDNPRNTMSLGALKMYSGFKHTQISVMEKLCLVDRYNRISTMDTAVSNDLDFIVLDIMTFKLDQQSNKSEMQMYDSSNKSVIISNMNVKNGSNSVDDGINQSNLFNL